MPLLKFVTARARLPAQEARALPDQRPSLARPSTKDIFHARIDESSKTAPTSLDYPACPASLGTLKVSVPPAVKLAAAITNDLKNERSGDESSRSRTANKGLVARARQSTRAPSRSGKSVDGKESSARTSAQSFRRSQTTMSIKRTCAISSSISFLISAVTRWLVTSFFRRE